MTLIVRNEPEGIRRYCTSVPAITTKKRAQVYTDLSLFTCRPELGRDATQLFNALTGFSKTENYEGNARRADRTAARDSRRSIERETEHARAGRPRADYRQTQRDQRRRHRGALYRASQAGVPIDLIVRGMCVLRPGVPGVSETIRVRSIVGRFLEHSRIFVVRECGRA